MTVDISPASDENRDAESSSRPALSALEIARELGLNPPTEEQIRIIESPLRPCLVIAGAGSGKTATMVDRVVWLVANGYVRADEILGVTFTRKAANELRERMRTRLNILRERKLIELAEDELLEGAADPTVATYHSYANTLVKDYGLRLGVEQDAQMLGEAQSWQLAAQIVQYWDEELPEGSDGEPVSKTHLVGQLLKLAAECAEHLVSPQQVVEFCTEQLDAYESLSGPGPKTAVRQVMRNLRAKLILARMVQRYGRIKARMQVLDYGDLIALAARIAREVPSATALERQRYRVVLLDEFQDTSHAQMQLFSDLFGARKEDGPGEHPVMAVGDPKQSIYGFRGASQGQLFSFYRYFPTREATPLYLSIAWRNDRAILDAANLIAGPLKDVPGRAAAAAVPDLRPRSIITRPDERALEAMRGSVLLARYSTDADEARGVAEKIASERASAVEAGRELPTMAVLTRTRAQMEPIRQACQALGVPVQVVGLGGLLERPEVIDTVAMLRVLADPNRSDALVRLLAGARWRLGTADLLALGEWSHELTRTREREFAAPDGNTSAPSTGSGPETGGPESGWDLAAARRGAMEDISEYGSLIEGIEHLPEPGWVARNGRSLSVEGLGRLQAFARELNYLRQFTTEELGTLLYEIERVLMLDIELASHEGADSLTSRAHLDAFHQVAASYAATSPRINAMIYAGPDGVGQEDAPNARRFVLSGSGISYLTGFLAWLDEAAEHEDGLEAAVQEPRPDTVQILTMHAAKGLEWDQVYLPRMNTDRRRGRGWQQAEAGLLPWPLRGDRDYLPQVLDRAEDIAALEDFRELKARLDEGEEQAQAHAETEDRRLTYVALTRARSLLHVSNCRWSGTQATPLVSSPYWNELVQFALGDSVPPHACINTIPWLYPGYAGTGYRTPDCKRASDPGVDEAFGQLLDAHHYTVPQGVVLAGGTRVSTTFAPDDSAPDNAWDEATGANCRAVCSALYRDSAHLVENARILGLPLAETVYRVLHPEGNTPASAKNVAPKTNNGAGGRQTAEAEPDTEQQLPERNELEDIISSRGGASGVRPQLIRRLLSPDAWGEHNPQRGSILTSMWPFDPLEGPRVWRWESEQALTEAMRLQLRQPGEAFDSGESNPNGAPLGGQLLAGGTGRRDKVERAAQNVLRGGTDSEPGTTLDAQTRQIIEDWEQEVHLLLSLNDRATAPAAPLRPEHLSASELMNLAEDPQQARARMLRPVPVQPSMAARTGTLFHEWVEQYYGAEPMLDLDDELYADTDSEAGVDMAKLRETFLASPWAQRSIWRAEYPVETHVAGVSVRGRIDAVFRTVTRANGQETVSWELVDWKTGRKPSAKAMRFKRIQLALYRLAFAKIQGISPNNVRAAFYYVGSDTTVWDTDIAGGLQDRGQLERIINRWDWG